MKLPIDIKSKKVQALIVLIPFLLVTILVFALREKNPIEVSADLNTQPLDAEPKSQLTLKDGTILKDVGFNPEVMEDLMTPEGQRIVFISSVHCQGCDADPSLVIYHVKIAKKLSLDLPGIYRPHVDPPGSQDEPLPPIDPYLNVKLYYGKCGQPHFGIWSFTHSIDDEILKRISVQVSETDLTYQIDKLSEQDFKSEIEKFKTFPNCQALKEGEFETM